MRQKEFLQGRLGFTVRIFPVLNQQIDQWKFLLIEKTSIFNDESLDALRTVLTLHGIQKGEEAFDLRGQGCSKYTYSTAASKVPTMYVMNESSLLL